MPASGGHDDAATGTIDTDRSGVLAIRERARRLFDSGATGVQVAAAITEAKEKLLRGFVEEALAGLSERTRRWVEREAAIVAVGGTARAEMSPFSDADLLFVHTSAAASAFGDVSAEIVRKCWDHGLDIGHGVRTIGETLSLAAQEIEVGTALVGARALWGSDPVFERLKRGFRRNACGMRAGAFVEACIRGRHAERAEHGGTVRQLVPDVKKSAGGLRDVHFLRWIGYARFQVDHVDSLRLCGALTRREARTLVTAVDFLLRIRHELHFHAGRAQDLLSRESQLRITAERGFEDAPGQRGVERFMQEYFRHASGIAAICDRFVSLHRSRPVLARVVDAILTHRVDDVFRVGPHVVDVSKRIRNDVCSDLTRVTDMYRLAALSNVVPSPQVVETLGRNPVSIPDRLTSAQAEGFLDVMRCTSSLGPVLRSLYQTGVLDCYVPEFTRTRGLLQFNQYHHFTVDEHTLRTIEAATAFENDAGPVGTVYRTIRHKEVLHLALLLHDLGKGFEQDHSEVGRGIALRTAERLHLERHVAEQLEFLVHRHLAMTHLAFRRDITDPDVVVRFSEEVGTLETLRMLYVLSAADLSGVGPGTLTNWKAELLHELYDRSAVYLGGGGSTHALEQRVERIRQAAANRLAGGGVDGAWAKRFLSRCPAHYLSSSDVDEIVEDALVVRELGENGVRIEGAFDPAWGTVEYRVYCRRETVPGYFCRITGVLTARGMDIISAQICTTSDGTVLDRFRVVDKDHEAEVPDWRIDEVSEALRDALGHETDVAALFLKHRRFGEDREERPLSKQRTKVVVDNHSSDGFTVVDVFTHDRRGLLFTITRTLFELGLSVSLAKISTHLDQVVDVFYVTDLDGRKIHDGERLNTIRDVLLETLGQYAQRESVTNP